MLSCSSLQDSDAPLKRSVSSSSRVSPTICAGPHQINGHWYVGIRTPIPDPAELLAAPQRTCPLQRRRLPVIRSPVVAAPPSARRSSGPHARASPTTSVSAVVRSPPRLCAPSPPLRRPQPVEPLIAGGGGGGGGGGGRFSSRTGPSTGRPASPPPRRPISPAGAETAPAALSWAPAAQGPVGRQRVTRRREPAGVGWGRGL